MNTFCWISEKWAGRKSDKYKTEIKLLFLSTSENCLSNTKTSFTIINWIRKYDEKYVFFRQFSERRPSLGAMKDKQFCSSAGGQFSQFASLSASGQLAPTTPTSNFTHTRELSLILKEIRYVECFPIFPLMNSRSYFTLQRPCV